MKNKVTIFAPASIANVGPGFDILGFALNGLGDTITLSHRNDERYVIESVGAVLPLEPGDNVATVGLKSFSDHVGHKGGFDIRIVKNFKPGSGLGSSASSAVGAVFAANALLKTGLSKEALVPFALDGEEVASKNRHADNIAPCMLGGFVGVTSCNPFKSFSVPYPNDLKVLVIFPDVVIKTAEARKILPKRIDMSTGIKQASNMAGLVTGLISHDYELISYSLHDAFAEPYRKQLIPLYDKVKTTCLQRGSIGFSISGSGPAMFSFFRAKIDTAALQHSLREMYKKADIGVLFHESGINHRGVEIVNVE